MLKILDEKFKTNKLGFLLQSLLATAVVFVILLVLDPVSNSAVIASLGASSFIAFTMPHAKESSFRCLVGGYLIGVIIGNLCYFISISGLVENIYFLDKHSAVIFCAIAVGLSIFLMVITNTEHPPAAGMALALFLNQAGLRAIIVVLAGITSLVIIKTWLRPYLKNLV
ncbi:MAG: HPP family protein [Candidatus Omnitrophica bacterium]|nr:HPP family protein [Candidatus Omnitrophota bacterium]